MPYDQYVIDEIRIQRLEKGISQRELSSIIGEAESVVGNIENPKRSNKYSDHHLNLIAAYLGCGVHDLIPNPPLENDSYQIKTKVIVHKRMGPTAMLNSLLEDGYFDKPRFIGDISTYCNSFFEEERKVTDFSGALSNLIENGKLKKIYVENDRVMYQKRKE